MSSCTHEVVHNIALTNPVGITVSSKSLKMQLVTRWERGLWGERSFNMNANCGLSCCVHGLIFTETDNHHDIFNLLHWMFSFGVVTDGTLQKDVCIIDLVVFFKWIENQIDF